VILAQLIVFQVHPGQCDEGGGTGGRDGRPVLADCEGCGCLAGQLCSAAQPAAQDLHQRQMPKAVGSFILRAQSGRGGRARIEDTGRRIEMA